MPTVYDGNPVGVQAPGIAPSPEGAPKLNVPADGDPPNASTYAQAYKILADYVAWNSKPQAKSTDWAKWIRAYRASNGHKRFLVDHMGLPGGRIQQWNEMWESGQDISGTFGPLALPGTPVAFNALFATKLIQAASSLTGAGAAPSLAVCQADLALAGGYLNDAALLYAAVNPVGAPWQVQAVKTAGGASGVQFALPQAAYSPRHNAVLLQVGDTLGNDYVNLWRQSNVTYSDDLTFALEWEAQLQAADLLKLTTGLGFSPPGVLCGSTPPANYAAFTLGPGGGNWFCSHGGAGVNAGVDSGVAASTAWTRFRIEFHGANVSDNLTRALRYYINGVQVGGDITTNVPVATALAAASFCVQNTNGGPNTLTDGPVRMGPARFVSNLYGADVA